MKRKILVFASMITIVYFIGCGHQHNYIDATCTEAKTCIDCGETEGEALGHDWIDADCNSPKSCKVCGETEGKALGHDWIDADCNSPKSCKVCGETEGKALGHDWIDANCNNPKNCKICGETEGEALEHKWVDADCNNPKTCSACGTTEGEAIGHNWMDADCDNPKTCNACRETEGEALGHLVEVGLCSQCDKIQNEPLLLEIASYVTDVGSLSQTVLDKVTSLNVSNFLECYYGISAVQPYFDNIKKDMQAVYKLCEGYSELKDIADKTKSALEAIPSRIQGSSGASIYAWLQDCATFMRQMEQFFSEFAELAGSLA